MSRRSRCKASWICRPAVLRVRPICTPITRCGWRRKYIPGITKDIVNIVGYTFGRELDRESLYYERFITHIKHFLARVVKNEAYGEDTNDRLAIMVKDEFPKSYRCALRIRDYLKVSRKYNVIFDLKLLLLKMYFMIWVYFQ